jgi:hypothetical protein
MGREPGGEFREPTGVAREPSGGARQPAAPEEAETSEPTSKNKTKKERHLEELTDIRYLYVPECLISDIRYLYVP